MAIVLLTTEAFHISLFLFSVILCSPNVPPTPLVIPRLFKLRALCSLDLEMWALL